MLVSPGQRVDPNPDQCVSQAALTPVGMATAQLAQVGLDRGRHLMRTTPGAMGAVGQGIQPAGPIAAQPAVDGLAADAGAVGDLDHREPVPDDFHDGVEALLCHCELQEHAPDLLTSPLVGEAQEARAVMSAINRNSGTHQPESTGQASTGSAQSHQTARARNLPETLLDAASSHPTMQPSTVPLTCAVVRERAVLEILRSAGFEASMSNDDLAPGVVEVLRDGRPPGPHEPTHAVRSTLTSAALCGPAVEGALVREPGDVSLHPQGRPCGRPPAAAILGRQHSGTADWML
jgi:hypothetical protein